MNTLNGESIWTKAWNLFKKSIWLFYLMLIRIQYFSTNRQKSLFPMKFKFSYFWITFEIKWTLVNTNFEGCWIKRNNFHFVLTQNYIISLMLFILFIVFFILQLEQECEYWYRDRIGQYSNKLNGRIRAPIKSYITKIMLNSFIESFLSIFRVLNKYYFYFFYFLFIAFYYLVALWKKIMLNCRSNSHPLNFLLSNPNIESLSCKRLDSWVERNHCLMC